MTETAEIDCPDPMVKGPGNGFGNSVAISGNTIVVGAPYESVNGLSREGTAFVYTKPAAGWTSTTPYARLTESNPTGNASAQANDGFFGTLVAIDGNTIAIASGYTTYMFTKPASGWTSTTETAQIPTSTIRSLSLSGNTLAVVDGAEILVYTEGSSWANTSKAVLTLNAKNITVPLDIMGLNVSPALAYSAVVEGNTIIALTDDGGIGGVMNNHTLTVSVYTEPTNGWTNMTPAVEVPLATNSICTMPSDVRNAISVSGNEVIAFSLGGECDWSPGTGSVIVLPVTPVMPKAVVTLKPIVAPVITPKPAATTKPAAALILIPKPTALPKTTSKAAAVVATWRTSIATSQNDAKKPTWYFSLSSRQ